MYEISHFCLFYIVFIGDLQEVELALEEGQVSLEITTTRITIYGYVKDKHIGNWNNISYWIHKSNRLIFSKIESF